jgi:hypothetical protein
MSIIKRTFEIALDIFEMRWREGGGVMYGNYLMSHNVGPEVCLLLE